MTRRNKSIVTIVAIVLIVGACTSPEQDEAPETSGAPTVSNLDRFKLAAKQLWRGDAGGLPEIMTAGWGSARFVDDVLFLEQGPSPMAVVNPATGEPYWTADSELLVENNPKYGDVELSNSTGRAPIAQVGGERVMFVSYGTGSNTEGGERETRIAAVRVTDANALWKAPRPAPTYNIVDADDRIVLLSLGSLGDRPMARAISAANGSTLWETQDVWAQFVAGDRVLGVVSSKPPKPVLEPPDDSYVVGLDAATGQRVWSLEGRYQRSEVGFVVGDVALVYAQPTSGGNPDMDAVLLIDVATGAEITRLGWDYGAREACAGDDGRLIACILDEEPESPPFDSARLVTFDVTSREKRATSPERQDEVNSVRVKKVWRDYIFVEGVTRRRGDWWAVDRDGIAVSDRLPGKLIGVSDEYAAFALPGERSIAAVYRIEK